MYEMRRSDIENAFGTQPRSFDERLERTLAGLPDEKPMRARRRLAPLIAAIVCVLALGGVTLAASYDWDIVDMINNRSLDTATSDDLRALSQSLDMTVTGKWAEYTFSEAVFDGRSLNVTITVRPLDASGVILMSDYCNEPDDVMPEYGGDNELSGETFTQRAAREGKMLILTGMRITGSGVSDNDASEYYNSDGSLTLYANCLLADDVNDSQRFTCLISERVVDSGDINRVEGEFTISPNTQLYHAEAHGKYSLDYASITDVYVSGSTLGTYVTLYGRLDEELTSEQLADWERSFLNVSVCEGVDTIINGGMVMVDENGEYSSTDKGARSFKYDFQMQAEQTLPAQLYAALYDFDTGEYGKTLVIPLEPAESEEN